jgi:Na+/pantothenate symporter
MRPIDWVVLIGTLVTIVAYGTWKGRHKKDLDGYLLAGRQLKWPTIALSIMATQASAITFLSTPGQAYRRHALRAVLPRPADRDGDPLHHRCPDLPPPENLHRV